jgi:hypothetical protein
LTHTEPASDQDDVRTVDAELMGDTQARCLVRQRQARMKRSPFPQAEAPAAEEEPTEAAILASVGAELVSEFE